MHQIIHTTQELITEQDTRKAGATDGARELGPCEFYLEDLGAAEQQDASIQLHRRRRAWRAAGGAIAGMMAARAAR